MSTGSVAKTAAAPHTDAPEAMSTDVSRSKRNILVPIHEPKISVLVSIVSDTKKPSIPTCEICPKVILKPYRTIANRSIFLALKVIPPCRDLDDRLLVAFANMMPNTMPITKGESPMLSTTLILDIPVAISAKIATKRTPDSNPLIFDDINLLVNKIL